MIRVVITGRTGSGKTSVINELIKIVSERNDLIYTKDANGLVIRKTEIEPDSENSAIISEVPIREMIDFKVVPRSSRILEIECSSVEQKNRLVNSKKYKGVDVITEMAQEARFYFRNLIDIRRRVHARVHNPDNKQHEAAVRVLEDIESLML